MSFKHLVQKVNRYPTGIIYAFHNIVQPVRSSVKRYTMYTIIEEQLKCLMKSYHPSNKPSDYHV